MVLQWDYIVLQRVAVSAASVQSAGVLREQHAKSVLQWCCPGVAVVLQRVALCCSVLQYVRHRKQSNPRGPHEPRKKSIFPPNSPTSQPEGSISRQKSFMCPKKGLTHPQKSPLYRQKSHITPQ